jgi:hypothetical protein
MTEAGSTGRVRPLDDTAWSADAEVPDADADEQRRELVDNPDEVDPETVAGRDRSHHLANPPLEVSEADLADQLMDVPFDDDDLDRG